MMKRGDLIFYIVLFGAWLLPYLLKKLSKSTPSPEKKGLTLRILEFIAKIKSAAEEQAGKTQPVLSQRIPAHPDETRITAKRPHSLAQSKRQGKFTGPQKTSRVSISTNIPLMANNPQRIRHNFPKKKLQNAIIWSEILQPPVGLRN